MHIHNTVWFWKRRLIIWKVISEDIADLGHCIDSIFSRHKISHSTAASQARACSFRLGVTLHVNLKLCSSEHLRAPWHCLYVNTLQWETGFSLHKDSVWRKLRSSPLALLLLINLWACASWLNDFVQTKNVTSIPPSKLWERRELGSMEETNRGSFKWKEDSFIMFSPDFWFLSECRRKLNLFVSVKYKGIIDSLRKLCRQTMLFSCFRKKFLHL